MASTTRVASLSTPLAGSWLYLNDQYLGEKAPVPCRCCAEDATSGADAVGSLGRTAQRFTWRTPASLKKRIENVYGKKDVPIFFPPLGGP